LAERSPEWLPSKSITALDVRTGCHHPVGLLSSRWPGLQSLCVVRLASYWLNAPAMTLPAGLPTAGLRGLFRTPWCGVVNTATSSSLALGSRPECEPSRCARPGPERRIAPSRYERPFLGFLCPTTLELASSDTHRAYLTRLRCAFRFSQPPDASFRPHPSGLVSCR
jgi:hypothetical protein